jgi:dTDP-4-dehydrorhamnose 3,5-epimerase
MDFVQDNVSLSQKGVLRGLHWQAPPAQQGKLVQVLRGAVLDVAVDIRHGSPTFGYYETVELTAQNHVQFWIPPGFAHAFLTLENNTLFSYKCTGYYSPEHDRGLMWNDPTVAITWPLTKYGISEPVVSEKDNNHPHLEELAKEFVYQDA